MIGPVLFCCYICKLVFNLEDNCIDCFTGCFIDCFIGKMLVGALTYADDIVLIAPTSRAMRRMLFTCDSVADNLSIVFNAYKMVVL